MMTQMRYSLDIGVFIYDFDWNITILLWKLLYLTIFVVPPHDEMNRNLKKYLHPFAYPAQNRAIVIYPTIFFSRVTSAVLHFLENSWKSTIA